MSASAGFTAQEIRDLRMVFGAFDVSDRGLVDAEDLRRALRVLGFKVSRRTVQEMGRDVDVEGTLRGRVDFEGFLQVVARLQGSSYDSHEEIIQVCSSRQTVEPCRVYMSLPSFTRAWKVLKPKQKVVIMNGSSHGQFFSKLNIV